MDKRPFKKHSIKEQDSAFREKYIILDEKYTKIKEILKQVLAELRELKLEKQRLTAEQEKLVAEIKEKDELLERMQSVSEAVIDEYTALKLKCDLETEAANNAIKRATKYFQENQKLKRNTGRESESDVAEKNTDEIRSEETLIDENTSELDVLNNLASELRTEIANLKTQLSKEIEKQNSLKEDFEIAKNLYEQEMKDHNCTKEKLQSIHSNLKREDSVSENYYCGNSFQSNQIGDSDSTKYNPGKHDDVEIINLTSKLELVEAEAANCKQENGKLQFKIQELESQIRKLNKEVSASDLLPIPPPPPPPPLPPPSFNPIKSLITFIHAGKKSAKIVKKEDSENPQQKAMSEMIDAIKKGNIQLKPTPKTVTLSPKKEVEETALGEMKNILASLKKKNSPCEDIKPAELPSVHEKRSIDFPNQETDENFNMGSDIDDELRSLLRKQSIKITTNKISEDELNADSLPVVICNDEGEIRKDFEIHLQKEAALEENQFVSRDFPDNSHLCSENEKNLEISSQESVVSCETWFTDSVLSDKSRVSLESERSPEVLSMDSVTSDKNKPAEDFHSNNSKSSMQNEASLEITLKDPISEKQLAGSVSSDCKLSSENERSCEIPLQESITGERLLHHLSSDDNKMSDKNEKNLGIPLQESFNENQSVNCVFSDENRKSAENDKNAGILLEELVNENLPADNVFSDDDRKSFEREGIPLQESINEDLSADIVYSDDSRKTAENEKSGGEFPLEEPVYENLPVHNVFSDGSRKSAGNEESLEISMQESTVSGGVQFADTFLSDYRLCSEKETSKI